MKKNKVLINIENLEDIDNYKKIGYNNFLFAVDKFSIGYNSFIIEDLINLDCNKYLLINRIFDNNDIQEFKSLIPNLHFFDGIFFEDIGVYNLLKDEGINLIWNQSHFATNYSSINYWLEYVFSAVISNELTSNEVSDILNKTNKPLVLNVFGKNPVMYSRRSLLSNFNTYYSVKMRNKAVIKDKVTDNEFLSIEDDNGTIFFDNNYFNIVNYLDNFNDNNILFYLIYPKDVDVEEINNIINNKSTIKYKDGFMNKKTIYKLEVMK